MRKRLIKEFKENKRAILFIFSAFFAWRIWLQVFLWLGFSVLPLKEILARPGLWVWANFDGNQYLNIAQKGYGNFDQVFFPFFPWLIRILVYLFQQSPFVLLISGLTISHLAFLVALFLFYKLIRIDFNDKVARLAILFLLVFPTSFFFGAVYTESLFLALILGSFYAARKKQWWIVGILGALASGTRLVGIFLLPALLWEWWEQQKMENGKWKMENFVGMVPILLIPLGLLFYMRFLNTFFQDSLMFLHVQPAYFVSGPAEKIILLYQVFWRYLKMIVSTRWDPLYFTVWLELLTTVGFGALLVYAQLKKIRFSYLIFAVFAFLAPTIGGTFCSMPRYVLVLFPCFIALPLIENRLFRTMFFVVCSMLLALATAFFTRGYWIG